MLSWVGADGAADLLGTFSLVQQLLMAYAKAGAAGTKAPPLVDVSQAHALVSAARANKCLSTIAAPLRSEPCCPPELVHELGRIQAHAWAIYMATAASIAPVLDRAAAEGITVVVYKGAAQAARWYEQPSARSMGDVDILVREDQKSRVYEIVSGLGFQRLVTPGRAVSARLSHERSYTAPLPGARVLDIHTFPTPPTRYRLPVAAMMERSVAGTVFDAPARFLTAEDELLVMAANQAYDHFRFGFVRYLDAWLLSTHGALAWTSLVDDAIAAGCATATWLTLANARRVAGAHVPSAVLAQTRPSRLRQWWLRALLDTDGLGGPRFSLPRRIEQGLLVYPVIDRPRSFFRFVAVHTRWRILDALKAMGDRIGDGQTSAL